MPSPPQTARHIPVVAVLCALIFCLYGVSPGSALNVRCQLPQTGLDAVPHCQVEQGRKLGWLPKQTTDFDWIDLTLSSQLCDNDPRGGVRFCHRLTLLGNHQRVMLPEWRTPLTADVVSQNLHRFMAGQGQETLTWSTPVSALETAQTLALALLLGLTAWGFGAWRWPSAKPLPLDGIDDLNIPKPGQR